MCLLEVKKALAWNGLNRPPKPPHDDAVGRKDVACECPKFAIPNCDLDPDIRQYGPVAASLSPTLIQKTVGVGHFLVGSNLTG
jgi:hypothetical protein